jgi:hypothetical protein
VLCLLALTAVAGGLGFTARAQAAQFFAASSVWNTPLDPNARVDPNSAVMVQELTREATQWGAWINTTSYSTPIYTVPANQPTVPVTLDAPLPWKDSAQRLANSFAAVPIPSGAVPAAGTDAQMTVLQPSTDTLWEFWHMSLQSDGWHARWGGMMTNVSQNPGYFGKADWLWGASATSLPLVAGLMTIQEQQAGQVNHALALALPAAYNCFVFPAQRGDGRWSDPRAIPEGATLRLDPSLNLASLNLPPYTRMLAQAAQTYGIIVRDYSPIPSFVGEDPTPTGSNPYPALWGSAWPNRVLAAFPWSSLQVVAMLPDYHATPAFRRPACPSSGL